MEHLIPITILAAIGFAVVAWNKPKSDGATFGGSVGYKHLPKYEKGRRSNG